MSRTKDRSGTKVKMRKKAQGATKHAAAHARRQVTPRRARRTNQTSQGSDN